MKIKILIFFHKKKKVMQYIESSFLHNLPLKLKNKSAQLSLGMSRVEHMWSESWALELKSVKKWYQSNWLAIKDILCNSYIKCSNSILVSSNIKICVDNKRLIFYSIKIYIWMNILNYWNYQYSKKFLSFFSLR